MVEGREWAPEEAERRLLVHRDEAGRSWGRRRLELRRLRVEGLWLSEGNGVRKPPAGDVAGEG